jgi:hypothetical protein
MSYVHFNITTRTNPCSHIRGYPHGTKHGKQEATLQLAIKKYTPLDNIPPKEGSVTIIAAHANGIPKEVYEPLWDDLLRFSRDEKNGFNIRNIWFADMAWQGASGVLNERIIGDDRKVFQLVFSTMTIKDLTFIAANYFDHSRDLLHMINNFRGEMPRPIVGIAHSMGACQLSEGPHLFLCLSKYAN